MQNEWNPIIIIEEWEWATQTVFKWRKNLHNKSNRERVFQLSALIKMFSYINRPNGERTPFRGGNVLGNWNQNTRERRHGMENVKAPAEELEIYFWPLNFCRHVSPAMEIISQFFQFAAPLTAATFELFKMFYRIRFYCVVLCPAPPPVSVPAVASFGIFRA